MNDLTRTAITSMEAAEWCSKELSKWSVNSLAFSFRQIL